MRACAHSRVRVYETWNTWRRLLRNVASFIWSFRAPFAAAFVGTFVPSGGIWAYCRYQKKAVPKTFIFDTSRFISESQRFLRFNLCQKSSQFLRCRKAAPFRICDMRIGYARVSTDIAARRLFGLAA